MAVDERIGRHVELQIDVAATGDEAALQCGAVDDQADEVVACVVPKTGTTVDADELSRFLRASLAPYKLPKRYLSYAELPKNAVGKVQKPALRDLLKP